MSPKEADVNQTNTTPIRVELTVTGVVQAVGFRPFVYRRATAHGLGGSVKNTGDAGVEIVLKGDSTAVDAFLEDLQESPPPLSVVESVDIIRREPLSETTNQQQDKSRQFTIAQSTTDESGSGTIPPDTGICQACLEDVRDTDSRYHNYWATSCVDCGPRYTVIESLPYDRPQTTMEPFSLCDDCQEEYTDPQDRRYHAQTIACPACGPELSLLNRDRETRAKGHDAITEATHRLRNGDIVAIRGIGGTHLACLATNQAAVQTLRNRTTRPGKPFALMAESTEVIEQFARVTEKEQALLTDVRRPIVALERLTDPKNEFEWLDAVAPGLHTVGVMLPYAGLHHLLFDDISSPLVMTSANHPGKPMATTVADIYDDVGNVIDAALAHDRRIAARCDDSVVRVVDGTRRFLRRSRGWVPKPLPRHVDGPPLLAFGAEFDNTIAIARDDEVVLSQHLGDIDGPETEAFLRATQTHLTELLGVSPAVVACDLHPQFVTSALAESYAERLTDETEPIRVQHHHAHAAGLLGEHNKERAIVITMDGTGYGPDGTIWGGEILDATRKSFERVGGLSAFTLPGGEAAVREPTRILASLLDNRSEILRLLSTQTALSTDEADTVYESAKAGVNAPVTTSAGRYLDAVSALLGICTERTYQGEPALRLESRASKAESVPFSHGFSPDCDDVRKMVTAGTSELTVPYTEREGKPVIDTPRLVNKLNELRDAHSTETLAATAQMALAEGLAILAIEMATRRNVSEIGISGGVTYNDAISQRIRELVEATDCRFLAPTLVPPGDAGISYGQAIVASELSTHKASHSGS